MDDIRYSEMQFLVAVRQEDFSGKIAYYAYSAANGPRFGMQPMHFDEMLLYLLENMLIEVNNEQIRKLVCKINGEGGMIPSGIDGNDWSYPRQGITTRLRQNAHALFITYRGMRRIEELRAELQRDRILDPMGIVLDARYFEPDLGRSMTDSSSTVAVIRCDMDHLKKINNEHGHLAGDQAIRRYLTHARAVFEKWGKLYRVGGDELAIIVCSQELSRCVALAESFLHSLQSDKMETNDRVQVPLSASIGIAISPPLSRDPQALHYEADARQIRAKERGRKCVVST